MVKVSETKIHAELSEEEQMQSNALHVAALIYAIKKHGLSRLELKVPTNELEELANELLQGKKGVGHMMRDDFTTFRIFGPQNEIHVGDEVPDIQ